jgi:hypothetical protein
LKKEQNAKFSEKIIRKSMLKKIITEKENSKNVMPNKVSQGCGCLLIILTLLGFLLKFHFVKAFLFVSVIGIVLFLQLIFKRN